MRPIGFLLALALAGCGDDTDSPPGERAPEPAEVTIEVDPQGVWSGGLQDPYAECTVHDALTGLTDWNACCPEGWVALGVHSGAVVCGRW